MRVAVATLALFALAAAAIACRSTPPATVPTEGSYDAALPPPIVGDASTASVTRDGGDIEIVTSDPCTLIMARTIDETSTTCATSGEADGMVVFITRQRDGGPPPPSCHSFPPTLKPHVMICASDSEVLRAIDFLSLQRRSTLQRNPLPRKR